MMNLLLCLALVSSLSLGAQALNETTSEEETVAPTISLKNNDSYYGDGCSLSIYGENFSNISAFTCTVYYPEDAFRSYVFYYDSSLPLATYDCSSVAGQITFSFLSGTKDGVSFSKKELFICRFYVTANAVAGASYYLTCAVGEVYDANKNAVSIASSSVIFKPGEITAATPTMNISLASSGATSFESGDEVSLIVTNAAFWSAVSTFRVILTYDYTIFDYVDFEPAETFASESNDINSSADGVLSWAMLSMNGTDVNGTIGTLKLKVKTDSATSSEVHANLSQVRLSDKTAVNGSDAFLTLTIRETLPKMRLTNLQTVGNEVSFDLVVDGRSEMACGDFTIAYPTDSLVYKDVTTSYGSNVIISPSKGDGKINFSYLNANGIHEDLTLLSVTLAKVDPLSDVSCDISIGLRYSDSLPQTENHEKISFSYIPLHNVSPFVLKSFALNESWDGAGESFDSLRQVYMNAGDSISIAVNGVALTESQIDVSAAGEFIRKDGSSLIANANQGFSFMFGWVAFDGIAKYSIWVSCGSCHGDPAIRRANQFALKLRKATDGVTICDSNGFVPEKKEEMVALLNEYNAFHGEVRIILDDLPSSDTSTVKETMEVLARGNQDGASHALTVFKESSGASFASVLSLFVFGGASCIFLLFRNKRREDDQFRRS